MLNTYQNNSIRGKLLVNKGGIWYILDADEFWRVSDENIPERGTVKSFVKHITTVKALGTTPERQSYTMTVMFFLFLFIILGFLSYTTGYEATIVILFPLIWLASAGGAFQMSYYKLGSDVLTTTGFFSKYIVAVIATLLVGGYAFNQLAKESR
jgi:hypothetical protein